MRRPTREQLDQAIIDSAAVLFARHGYSHTSVQQIADAVGYSKTGLLHRFPSKEALRRAVVEQIVAELDIIVATVEGQPVGAERDLTVIRGLAALALRRRGPIALMISALTSHESPDDLAWLKDVARAVFAAFDVSDPVEPHCAVPDEVTLDRCVRIYGALGALGLISLATTGTPGERISDTLVATAYDALGHPART